VISTDKWGTGRRDRDRRRKQQQQQQQQQQRQEQVAESNHDPCTIYSTTACRLNIQRGCDVSGRAAAFICSRTNRTAVDCNPGNSVSMRTGIPLVIGIAQIGIFSVLGHHHGVHRH